MDTPTNIFGVFIAIISAFVWGSADFSGGLATRRSNQYHVLVTSAISGLVVLVLAAFLWQEAFISPSSWVWAMLGGISGALGIAAFYRALSTGHMAIVSPTAGVIGASMPVIYGSLAEGLPAPSRLVGFGLALIGIWLVSSSSGGREKGTSMEFFLAVLSGIGFGGFLIFLGMVEPGKIFTPLIVARSFTLLTGLILVRVNRLPLPSLRGNPMALLAGVLDAGGNVFYVLAKQYTRLDIAAVLASLYPAATILLASIVLKQKGSPRRWFGVAACLGAIVLITI